MDQKLKDLTEKLYNEGVSKGSQEADEIVASANQQSSEIIAKAEVEAKVIVTEAQKKAAELEKNTKSELQLAARQMMSALKQEIVAVVNGKIVGDAITNATNDKLFIQELLLAAVTNWSKKQDLLVVVDSTDHKDVEDFFTAKAKAVLESGVKIDSINGMKAGFQIGPADGSYKVSFTQTDFIEFFKEFVRPKVVELLFEEK